MMPCDNGECSGPLEELAPDAPWLLDEVRLAVDDRAD